LQDILNGFGHATAELLAAGKRPALLNPKSMTLYEIVKKLNGPILPVGNTTQDNNRLENLKQLFPLVEQLLREIRDAAWYKNKQEHSMREIGKQADEFLNSVKEHIL
jgi:hypothetical protein